MARAKVNHEAVKAPAAVLSLAAAAAATRPRSSSAWSRKVNGDIVTLSEFEARQLAAVQAGRVRPERDRDLSSARTTRRILQEAIDDLLILQRGEELGIRLRAEYVDEVIEGIKKENNIADDAELQRQLRREGMSLDDLKRNIERSIVRRQVVSRELESKVRRERRGGPRGVRARQDARTSAAPASTSRRSWSADAASRPGPTGGARPRRRGLSGAGPRALHRAPQGGRRRPRGRCTVAR